MTIAKLLCCLNKLYCFVDTVSDAECDDDDDDDDGMSVSNTHVETGKLASDTVQVTSTDEHDDNDDGSDDDDDYALTTAGANIQDIHSTSCKLFIVFVTCLFPLQEH